jgi:hypothetical protein
MSHVLAFHVLANVTDHHPNPPHYSAIRSWRTEDGEGNAEDLRSRNKDKHTHNPVSQKRIQTDRLDTACGLYASAIRQPQAVPSGNRIDEGMGMR